MGSILGDGEMKLKRIPHFISIDLRRAGRPKEIDKGILLIDSVCSTRDSARKALKLEEWKNSLVVLWARPIL